MNVVIYARFSSHTQTEQSIEGQLKVCYDFAKANNYTVIGEYIDRAISGTSDNRPEFQRMIADSERHTFEGVLVYQLDRFSRNRYDSAINKAKLKKNGVRVISARENIADDASGILIEGVLESMAEYYSAELAQKSHRGMEINAKKCLSNGSNPGLGFKVAEDRTFYVDENEAVIVREIFERYAKGEPVTEIINDLNARQIKTSLGREFNKNSLHRMLRNKRYIGTYLYKGEETPGGMPRIIEGELFERVQAILDKNKAAPARSRGKEEYVLTTKLFCGYCREMMTGYGGTGKSGKAYHYYACKNAKKHKCQKKVVDKNRIKKIVYDTCAKLLTDENIRRIAEALDAVYKNEQDTFAEKRIRDAIKEADKAIENLWAALEKGEATGMITERINKRQQEKEALEAQLAIEQKKEAFCSKEKVIFFLQQLQKGNYENPVHRRCTISIFIRAIYLYDDRFTIYLNGSNEPIAIEVVFLDEVEDYFDSQFSDSAECSLLVADAPPCRRKRHIACGDFLQKSSCAHSAAAPFHIEPAALGFDLVLGRGPNGCIFFVNKRQMNIGRTPTFQRRLCRSCSVLMSKQKMRVKVVKPWPSFSVLGVFVLLPPLVFRGLAVFLALERPLAALVMRRISDKTPLSRIVLTATRRHCQRTSSGLSSNLGAHSPCR